MPTAGFFFAARGLGIGESVVSALAPRPETEGEAGLTGKFRESWVGKRFREWMVEGEARAERAGRRYGWFGYEKGSKPPSLSPKEQAERHAEAVLTGRIAGDVANAVVAYALTKVSLVLSALCIRCMKRENVAYVRCTSAGPSSCQDWPVDVPRPAFLEDIHTTSGVSSLSCISTEINIVGPINVPSDCVTLEFIRLLGCFPALRQIGEYFTCSYMILCLPRS